MLELPVVVICGFFSIPVFVFCIQVLMAATAPRKAEVDETATGSRVAVLIPAHDEALLIGKTIDSLLPQLEQGDYILVVADNCSDDTAGIAGEAGTEVIIRQDEHRRGKGYALDFGIGHIGASENEPDVVVIVDADCIVAERGLRRLVSQCARTGHPVQARYLMNRADDSPGQKIAEFAWLVKNWVRPLGYMRLGLPCQLMGTGMAFPFKMLQSVNIAGSNIVEDMQLGIDLARRGYAPHFCPQAVVESTFPMDASSVKSQRTRWEHGHLNTIVTKGFKLLGRAVIKKDLGLLAMALDLTVPPLAFLAIILFVLFGTTLVFGFLHLTGILPVVMSLAIGILFGSSVLLAWSRFARHILSVGELLSVPGYVIRKIPMYVRFWKRRQKDWVRTGRN